MGPFRREAQDDRRAEGIERNAVWAALGTAAKIASLKGRRGQSKRQLTKLEKVEGI